MSNFQRLLGMASKALDKNGQSPSAGSGKTDWRDMVRTVADKVTGDSSTTPPQPNVPAAQSSPRASAGSTAQGKANPAGAANLSTEDRAAIARYDYLLKNAHPEQLEQVHRDAFARLTPAQREQVGAQLREELPAYEQPASSAPNDLARAAARGEAHQPGLLKRVFSKPSGRGAAGMLAGAGVGAVAGAGIGAAGGLLAAVAGGAILSSVAAPLLEQATNLGVDFENLAGGLDGLGGEAGEYVSGLGEQVSGVGEQVSDLGSNFEFPGLGSLGGLFDRN